MIGSAFYIITRSQYLTDRTPNSDDIESRFDFLRGIATLVLVEDGYVVEGYGAEWVHWIKVQKLIVIRGFQRPDPPDDKWLIPFYNQQITESAEPDVSQEEMNALAQRLSNASGWEWVEGICPGKKTTGVGRCAQMASSRASGLLAI